MSFESHFVSRVLDCAGNSYKNNHDHYRFGPAFRKPLKVTAKSTVRHLLNMMGVIRTRTAKLRMVDAVNLIQDRLQDFRAVYDLFVDDESRNTFVDIIAYRALGKECVKLSLNTRLYWKRMRQISREFTPLDLAVSGFEDWKLGEVEVSVADHSLQVLSTPRNIMAQFELEQYRCATEGREIAVNDGDVVLDCGGCWADTALNFAAYTGEKGKVYSFEFIPGNLEICVKNLERNPSVSNRIELVQKAVWKRSGEQFYFQDKGPASRVSLSEFGDHNGTVESISLDDHVNSLAERKCDFIKMDIEGAEMDALLGAQYTLTELSPQLAISVYHRFHDLIDIPLYIKKIQPNYRLYLRHFTIHQEETVLFASAD